MLGVGRLSGGDRIRTCDLEVMSLASYRAAPPRTDIVASTVLGERAIGYFFAGR